MSDGAAEQRGISAGRRTRRAPCFPRPRPRPQFRLPSALLHDKHAMHLVTLSNALRAKSCRRNAASCSSAVGLGVARSRAARARFPLMSLRQNGTARCNCVSLHVTARHRRRGARDHHGCRQVCPIPPSRLPGAMARAPTRHRDSHGSIVHMWNPPTMWRLHLSSRIGQYKGSERLRRLRPSKSGASLRGS